MAENSPPVEEGGQEPFPTITSLPHTHPATSFSSSSQAELDRQAMPPPPQPSSTAPAPAPALNASTPGFEPRVLHPFRLGDVFSEEREAWLSSSAAHFQTLVQRTGNILSSLTLARGLDEEMRVINRAIEINEEGQRLYTHIIDGLVGLCGPEDVELGLVRADWHTFMDEEFHADAARAARCGRDLLKRKAIVQRQLECRDRMGQLAKDQAEMARQGIVGPVGATLIPLAVGVPEPVYNKMFLPQVAVPPHFSGIAWPQQDPKQAPNGIRLPADPHVNPVSTSPLQGRPAGIPANGKGSQSAFANQFEIVASPKPIHAASARRHDSFGRNAQSSRQEFLAAIRSGSYDYMSNRRPTNGSQGSFEGHLKSRSWSSNSPTKQRPIFGTAEKEWQNAQYEDPTTKQGGHSNQSPRNSTDDRGQGQHVRLDKGKGHETSPPKHRGRSPTKNRERRDSRSPSKKHLRSASIVSVRDVNSHTVAAADHSHPMPPAPSASGIENADMLTAWGQQHTPKTSDRGRSDDSDVPPFKLDDPAPSDASKSSLNASHSNTSESDTLTPHLQRKKSNSALDLKQGAKSTEKTETQREQYLPPAKQESKLQGKLNKGVESAAGFSKPLSDERSVAANASSKQPSEKPTRSDTPTGEALKRTESNEWQLAQPKNRREHASKANNKNKSQPTKEKLFKSEDATRKKSSGNDPSQERELSGRGDKKIVKRGKGSGTGSRGQDQSQGQSFDTAEGYRAENQSKKGKGKEVAELYIADLSYRHDTSEAAFPSLASPATALSHKEAQKVSMSWSAALKSTELRIEAEKLRLAAETVLPMSPDAVFVQKASVSEKNVSAPVVLIANAFTYASAASGQLETGHALIFKQKTRGPKARGSSGELRATATPFMPPAAGSSLLSSGTQVSLAVPALNSNLSIPTYAQRAAAASAREEGAAALTAKQAKKVHKASAKLAAQKLGVTTTGSILGSSFGEIVSYADLASKFQQNQKGASKLNLSEHAVSMSVPTSIAGSVSSPSIASVKSLPSTPMAPTYAQRAASASLLAITSVAKPKDEELSERSGNTSTPKPAKEPLPMPSTLVHMSPDSSLKTIRRSTSKSSLNAAARSFSYASKLAAPTPPVMTSLVDNSPKEEEKADLTSKNAKAAGSKSAPLVRGPGKKDPKDKVRDSPDGGFLILTTARTIPATPIIPSWAQKSSAQKYGRRMGLDRHTLLRLTAKQNKKPGSALANGSSPTIDGSAVTAKSPDSARASFASTATTSASSATLVSSETISSESASCTNRREKSDVGPPSPVYRIKAPYKPAKPWSEGGYNAPPPTTSSIETWAQKAGQRYVKPPPMDVQERLELERESRLTTPTGARGFKGVRGEELWRGGKAGQARSIGGGSEADEGVEINEGRALSEQEVPAATWRTLSETSENGYSRGDDNSSIGTGGQGGEGEVQSPAESLHGSGDSARRSPPLGKNRSQSRSQPDGEESCAEGGISADSRVRAPAAGAGTATQGREEEGDAEEVEDGETPRGRRRLSPGYGREAEDADATGAVGKQQEIFQTEAQEPVDEDSAFGESGELKSAEESSVAGSCDSQGTIKIRAKPNQKTKGERAREKKARARKAKVKVKETNTAEATSVAAKVEELKVEDEKTHGTPKKMFWADADEDDDEWAGFESLKTPEVKEQNEKKGG